MIDFIKKHFTKLLLVVVYTTLALVIYIVWFNSLWHLWYVDVITGVVILGLGIFLGYDYIKGEIKEEQEKLKKEEGKPIEEVMPTNDNTETENIGDNDGE